MRARRAIGSGLRQLVLRPFPHATLHPASVNLYIDRRCHSDRINRNTTTQSRSASTTSSDETAPRLGTLVARFFSRVHPDTLASISEQSAEHNAISLAKLNDLLSALRYLPKKADNNTPEGSGTLRDRSQALRSLPVELRLSFDIQPKNNSAIRSVSALIPLRAPEVLVERQLAAARDAHRKKKSTLRRKTNSDNVDNDDGFQEDTAFVHLQFASMALELALYQMFPGCGLELTPAMQRRAQTLYVLVVGEAVQADEDTRGGAEDEYNRDAGAQVQRELGWMQQQADPSAEFRGLLQIHMSSVMKDSVWTDFEMNSAHARLGELSERADNLKSMKKIKFQEKRVTPSISKHGADAWLSPFDLSLVFVEPHVPVHVKNMATAAVLRQGRELHRRACGNLPLAPANVEQSASPLGRVIDAEADEIANGRAHDWSGISIMLTADDADMRWVLSDDAYEQALLSRTKLHRDGWVLLPASALAKVQAADDFDGDGANVVFDKIADFVARLLAKQTPTAQALRDARRSALRRCSSLAQMLQVDILRCRGVILGSNEIQAVTCEALDPIDAERVLSELTLNPFVFEELVSFGESTWKNLELRIVGTALNHDESLSDIIAFADPGSNAVCIVASPDQRDPAELRAALSSVKAEFSPISTINQATY